MSASWLRTVNTTIRKHIRDEQVATLRNNILLDRMDRKGMITFNHAGDGFDWPVRYKQQPMNTYGEMQQVSFIQTNLWKKAVLEWRAYLMPDAMSEGEFLKNRGMEAIVKQWTGKFERMNEAMSEQMADELYVDGNAAGNEDALHGIMSFMGDGGVATGTDVGSFTGYGSDTGSFIAIPSDTYAGLSTAIGAVTGEGTWTGPWPSGSGTPDFDYWSPLIVDYTDGDWSATTDTFVNTAPEALTYGIIHSGKNKSKKGKLDLIILARDLYRDLMSNQINNQRLVIMRGGTKDGAYSMGVNNAENMVYWDGVEITHEFAVPVDVTNSRPQGFGWNTSQVELLCQHGQLFEPKGPNWVDASNAWVYQLTFYGNLRFESPRYFVCWRGRT